MRFERPLDGGQVIGRRASDGVASDGQPSIDIAAFGQIVLVILLHVLNAVAYALGVLNALIRRNTRALDA